MLIFTSTFLEYTITDIILRTNNIIAKSSYGGIYQERWMDEKDAYLGDSTPPVSGSVNGYTSEMKEVLSNQGTLNTLRYLCKDENFVNSITVYQNDKSFSEKISMALSDAIYRGSDGWKDLFNADTSVEDAEKIIASLLDSYKLDCEELSRAKTAQKYASINVDGYNDFLRSDAITSMLGRKEIQELQDAMQNVDVAELLIDQEYKKIIDNLIKKCDIPLSDEVNQTLYSFYESKELMNSLNSGLKALDTGLNVLSITQDTVNKFYEMESLLTADEMYMSDDIKHIFSHWFLISRKGEKTTGSASGFLFFYPPHITPSFVRRLPSVRLPSCLLVRKGAAGMPFPPNRVIS